MTNDNRYLPRWEVKNKIVFRLNGDKHVHEAQSYDLNATGMCLVSHHPLLLNQKMKIKIYFSEKKIVEVEGQVMWVREEKKVQLAGINFLNVSEKTQEQMLEHAFELEKKDVGKQLLTGWKKK